MNQINITIPPNAPIGSAVSLQVMSADGKVLEYSSSDDRDPVKLASLSLIRKLSRDSEWHRGLDNVSPSVGREFLGGCWPTKRGQFFRPVGAKARCAL